MDVLGTIRRSGHLLRGERRGRVLVVVALGWGLLVGTRMSYPVLLPYVRDAYGLSLSVAGLLVTILWLGSALGQLPGGILADKFNERHLMTASLLVVAAALSVVALSGNSFVLFLATGFVGLGLSLYPIARITVLSAIFPDSIGSALGVTMATGDIGQTILPPLVGLIAAAIAWQLGLGLLVPVFLLVAALIWAVVPDGTSSSENSFSLEHGRAVLDTLWTRPMAVTTVVLFVYILVWQSFTGFYPTYLVEVKQFSPGIASATFAFFFAVGVVVKPVSGAAYDRIGMRYSLLAVLIGPVIGLGLLPFIDGFWTIIGVTALVSTMLGSGAITQSFLADEIPSAMRGTGLGVVRTTAATLGSVGPVIFGVLADNGYFDEGYLILAALMLLMIATIRLLPETEH